MPRDSRRSCLISLITRLNLRTEAINLELFASLPLPGAEGLTFTLTTVITDTGIGMNAEGLAKLFQPFAQVDTSYSKRPGTGLGLSICKDLIKLMIGEINMSSEPGKGTRVIGVTKRVVAKGNRIGPLFQFCNA
jgi:signal transduction histidine kinase